MSSTPDHGSAAPRTGAYEILFELAHGGMGTVYLARAMGEPAGAFGFERLVAIKRLHRHLLANADAVKRFLDEANVAAQVHHSNVVSVHQVGNDDAGQFLVQDYVEGDTLEGLIDRATLRRERLPPPIALRIAIDALSGLHAVHEAIDASGRPLGILHRDVSPQNLLIGRDGVTRVVDFGIAKHTMSSVVTDGHYLQGKVLYMPPEYLARRPVDRRFDVYGMGITLWTALSGEPPWVDANEGTVVLLATTEGVPPLSASGLEIAPAVEAIVARAVHKDPGARFSTAREMLEAIEDLGRHTGWIASHAEVAALVERLLGADLAARRAALQRTREGTPRRGTATAIGARGAEESGANVAKEIAAEAEEDEVALPVARGRAWIAVAAVAALLLASAAAIGLSRGRGDAPAASASTAQASAAASTTASAATAQAATATANAQATAPSNAAAATPSAAPSAREPVAASAAARAPRPGPPAAKAAPAESLEVKGPPATIATQNPYR